MCVVGARSCEPEGILGFVPGLIHIARAIQSIGKTETLHQKALI
jgi:hypothetical protein